MKFPREILETFLKAYLKYSHFIIPTNFTLKIFIFYTKNS